MMDPVARLNAALAGRYRVERQLGEGGMASVYLATDLKHDRKVALKVLKPELAAVVGAERFLAEIRTTANLQHPHVLPLHDSGEADGLLFYVMPFIEGETLRDRLDREHQLPVDEAVRIATNVAEALDYAHRHGVIHRDIKPANILLVDGKPVVADFGIALAVTSGSAGRMTETGLSLGTPHYMSPEQATGDAHVGPATDIWALGCVLYEMLAGEPPYPASTPQAVLGKIITAEPPSVMEVRKSVPPNVDAAIRKALEKVPADRFAAAGELAKALADSAFLHGGLSVAPMRARWNLLLTGASISTVGLAVAVGWLWLAPGETVPVTRLELTLPNGVVLPEVGRNIDVSPDGSGVVFVGLTADGGSLWYRALVELDAAPIPGTTTTPLPPAAPSFSPDNRSIAFRAGGDIRVISLDGAPTRTLVQGAALRDLKWGADGWIYFGNDAGGISRIPATGGDVEVVTHLEEGQNAHSNPYILPEERGILLTLTASNVNDASVAVASADGEARTLFPGRTPAYVSTGHIVFASPDGKLLAARFDLRTLEPTSAPLEVVDNLFLATAGGRTGRFALSDNGMLVYARGTASGNELVWVDRSGAERSVDPSSPAIFYNNRSIALSPDDRRVAIAYPPAEPDLWVKELPDGPPTRLTMDEGSDRTPVWSRNGETITYTWWRSAADIGEVRSVRADGSSEGRYDVVFERAAGEVQFTRDEQGMVFREGNSTDAPDPRDREGDIGFVDLATGEVRERMIESSSIERSISLSPDDRFLAYVSNESGTDEVYVRPWPDVESWEVRVSRNGGGEPLWSHGGRELFYREPVSGAMMVATFVENPTFRVATRESLFDASPYLSAGGPWRAFDVASDDQRFIMIRRQHSSEGAVPLIVVQNFFEDLRRLAPS